MKQSNYYQVFISAEDKKQANTILNALLKKKLILGGPILKGPARFWWKGKVVEMDYCYLFTYTKSNLKEKIIQEVNLVSVEEIPMVSFIPFEGNDKLLKLIDETLN